MSERPVARPTPVTQILSRPSGARTTLSATRWGLLTASITARHAPTAIICASGGLEAVLDELVRAAGLDVTAVVDRGVDAAVEAARLSPNAVVIDLASAGSIGAQVVSLIHRLVPEAAVIAMVPFPDLAARVVALGATAALHEDELHLLPRLLFDQVESSTSNGSVSTNPRDSM